MEATVITTAITGVITNVTEIASAAAPLVLGAMGTLAGINVGLKLFKRYVNKAA